MKTGGRPRRPIYREARIAYDAATPGTKKDVLMEYAAKAKVTPETLKRKIMQQRAQERMLRPQSTTQHDMKDAAK